MAHGSVQFPSAAGVWKFVALGVPIPSESGYNPVSPFPTESWAKDTCDKEVGRPEAQPYMWKRATLVRQYVECMKNYGWAPA